MANVVQFPNIYRAPHPILNDKPAPVVIIPVVFKERPETLARQRLNWRRPTPDDLRKHRRIQ